MKNRDSIIIAAEPEVIWPFVTDPVLQSTWNPKIIDVKRRSTRPLQLGERFNMTYRMSGRDRETDVEVIECVSPSRVTFRHHFEHNGRWLFADEEYLLEPRGSWTRVGQALDLSGAGIPWVFRALIWLVNRTGKPVGRSYMELLRDAVEHGCNVHAAAETALTAPALPRDI